MKLVAIGAALATGGEALINHNIGATFGQVATEGSNALEIVANLKVYSKEELMAKMTQADAVEAFLHMNSTHKKPELTAMVQTLRTASASTPPVSMVKKAMTVLRNVMGKKHGNEPTGYSAVDGATTMLNEMSEDTRTALDLEVEKCTVEHKRATEEMDALRIAVSNFNAAAAGARGKVLDAQGIISSVSVQVRDTSDLFEDHKKDCKEEIYNLNEQLRVVNADMGVMSNVLGMMDCPEPPQGQPSLGPPPGGQGILMVECRQCASKVLLNHPVQRMLSSLKSEVVKQFVQESLQDSYDDSLDGEAAKPLPKEGVKSLLSFIQGRNQDTPALPDAGEAWEQHLGAFTKCSESAGMTAASEDECQSRALAAESKYFQWEATAGYCDFLDSCDSPMHNQTADWRIFKAPGSLFPNNTLNVSGVPTMPVVEDCVDDGKCTIGTSPNCQKLKDRFLVVQAGIYDKKNQLEFDLREKENFCEEETISYTNQLKSMQNKLGGERAKLAVATDEQNGAESSSHSQSEAHAAASIEFVKNSKECCDNQNEMKSELCALGKIRGELTRMEGTEVFITDCEVSDWQEEDCSKSCAGGTLKSTRSVLTHRIGKGLTCPKLEKVENCNDHPCPIDCVAGQFSQWSECSANCGGGVMERSRPVFVEPLHEGEPCSETEQAIDCNMDACNVNCVLDEWSDWSTCSKACGGGTVKSIRPVKTVERGTGTCAGALDDERLKFFPCNDQAEDTCAEKLKIINGVDGVRTQLKCNSMVDVVVLLDGSGSLTVDAWKSAKKLAGSVIRNLGNGAGNALASLVLFSGPGGQEDYVACTQGDAPVDLVKQCKINMISHFTNNTAALGMQAELLNHPAGSTLTSVALGVAESELKYGRADASSKVVVITDGKPMSPRNTRQANKALQEQAQVIFVPIGKAAPFELVASIAAKPASDHMVPVHGGFASLAPNGTNTTAMDHLINEIISSVCPEVM